MEQQKAIGPSFYDELLSAGLAGLPFSWTADGALNFDSAMTAAQIESVEAVYKTHDAAAPSWSDRQQQAKVALSDSDLTMLRCFENGVTVPAEWATYRKALRAILGASSGDATKPLPARPTYPQGT